MRALFNRKFLLVLILLIAAFLRFYQLGINPPSLTWDEVSWGYNAYSLGIDGRDEFGRFLPYDYLESFGDFKPPMYAYLAVIPVKLFGLTEFATRFPSAFFGTLTVLLSYFLVRRLFLKSKHVEVYALITSGLLAISPWHIMLSRAAFEANVATFFLILGVYSFLAGVQKKPWMLSVSAFSFVASMYTFNTSRIVAPLLLIMLMIGFWKKLLQYKNYTLIAMIIGLVFLLPAIPFLLSDQAKLRFKEVNIFTDSGVVKMANQEIANDNNVWWSKLLHNRRLGYSVSYINHYFDNLTPDFLFIKGDGNPKFSTQATGEMYIWEFPFFIAGILFLFRKREGYWWIVPVWLLLAIIPAATARETPHALRIETTLPTFQMLVAYGIVQLFLLIQGYSLSNIKYKVMKKILYTCFAVIVLGNLTYFCENYFAHYAKEFAGEWQYGAKDAVLYGNTVENQYATVFLTQEIGRPYIYTLFYKQYDPKLFRQQASVTREAAGFVTVKSFGKYSFDSNLLDSKPKNALYIVTPADVPKNANVKKTFYLPNGQVSLVAYTLN